MNKIISEDSLREAYSAFESDHERLRTELLTSLPTDSPVRLRILQKTWQPTWIAVGASACLMIAVITWIAIGGVALRPAYALDGIRARFLHIRSLHVKGTFYQTFEVDGQEVEKLYPLEWYAERPSRYFHTHSITEHDAKGVRVRHSHILADGERTFFVSESDRLAARGKSDLLATELKVETFLQREWTRQIVHGPTTDYQLTGTEEVRGRKTLKYERVKNQDDVGTRSVVWLSSATGMPVRSAIYRIDASGRERPLMVYETIEIDVPPPPEMFSFEAPEGFRLVEGEGQTADFDVGSAGAGNDRAAQRYSFAIDRLAILVCWYHGVDRADANAPENVPVVPQAELLGTSESRRCELYPLLVQNDDGRLWRWSLAIPLDRRPVNSEETFKLTFKYPSGSSSSFEDSPLILDDKHLRNAITRMKELGTAVGEIQPEMTLVRLRWLAAHYLTREADTDLSGEVKK